VELGSKNGANDSKLNSKALRFAEAVTTVNNLTNPACVRRWMQPFMFNCH